MEMQMPMSQVMAVMVTGMVVVFVGLILLIAVISIVGKIFESINNSKKKEIAEPATVKNADFASADENEVIAAIAAAVAMMGVADNTTYKIKSIKAANNACASRSAWAMAGLNESTSPF